MTEIKEFGEKVLVKRADCPASRPPLYLSPFAPLVQASATRGRQRCPSCNGSRLYFCYDCRRFMSGIEPFSPKVELPVRVDILKHGREKNSKSTAVHALLAAPDHVHIFDSFDTVPFYRSRTTTNKVVAKNNEENGESERSENVALVLPPSSGSLSVADHVRAHGLVDRFIFLDGTWAHIHALRQLPQLAGLPVVHLGAYRTDFWRHQRTKTDDHLATVEAVFFACREHHDAAAAVLHIAGGEPPAAPPQFDDLLFWFYFFRLERVGGVSESKKKSNENKVESE